MGNRQRISDEEILAALVANVGAVTKAAECVGCSPRTVWQRMQNPNFRKQLDTYRKQNLQIAVVGLQAATIEALTTITAIMQDTESPPAVRLNAAKMILDDVLKFDTQMTDAVMRENREGLMSQLLDGLRYLSEDDEAEDDLSD